MTVDIAHEIKILDKWIFNNMPLSDIQLYILCTYVEAFKLPFKIKKEMIVSYNTPFTNLYIRKQYWNDAVQLKNEGIVEYEELAISNFPEKFVLTAAKDFKYSASEHQMYHHGIAGSSAKNIISVGKTTGRYYIDAYGYCWFEMACYYLTDMIYNPIAWVRETSVNYEGKEAMQALIDENRAIIMKMRDGTIAPAASTNKSKLTAFLALGLTLLSSK